MPSNF